MKKGPKHSLFFSPCWLFLKPANPRLEVNISPTLPPCPYRYIKTRMTRSGLAWHLLMYIGWIWKAFCIWLTSSEVLPSLIHQKCTPSFILRVLLPQHGLFPILPLACCLRGPLLLFYGTCPRVWYPAQMTRAVRVIFQGCSSQKQGSTTQGRNASLQITGANSPHLHTGQWA